ncbi:molybdopterin-dependent oxidoreductase [Kribbella sp. CA-253562]|uniref:molybdopterin-dependent oxidoreductase n=1 Tax=Kribbella sp. CA-253562 TaxID=3239942 RepID=UPI003D94112E
MADALPPDSPESHDDTAGRPIGRRIVLSTIAAGVAGLFVAPSLQEKWSQMLGAASQRDPTGLSGLLPNPGGFRYFSVAGSVPEKNASTYRLTVDGLVDKPTTYTLAQLGAMPQSRVTHDVVCTDGWQVDDVPFAGVPLAKILDAAGVRPTAKAVRFTCFDGVYSESLTMEQARRPDVLVATRMLDQPIPHISGGPVRLFVGPMYFYKSAKWLSGITVTDEVVPGYWEEYGYPVDGWLPGEEPAGA